MLTSLIVISHRGAGGEELQSEELNSLKAPEPYIVSPVSEGSRYIM